MPRFPLAGRVQAPEVFRLLHADSTDVFWLDGGETSYIGAGTPWYPGLGGHRGGVLEALREELGHAARQQREAGAVPGEGGISGEGRMPGMPGMLGVVGWLGYEVLGETVGADALTFGVHRQSAYPDAAFLRVDRAVAIAADGTAELRAAGDTWHGELETWRRITAERLEQATAAPCAPPSPDRTPAPRRRVRWRETDSQYLANIATCQAAIRAGDAYVLNLTTEATVTSDQAPLDPVSVYRALRRGSPSPHGALLRIGGVSLLSASPELFLDIDPSGRVQTSPVKGTRARSGHPPTDAGRAAELGANTKERAENTMIVDLMRNDLARVCLPGSVRVTSLLAVETHAHVHQLVSSIEGLLPPGSGAVDMLRAAFPAGSMTGAPKRRAVEILDAVEGRARGLYAGTFGFLGVDGRAELAMTIRSIVLENGVATIGVGGGITALSDPAEELAEMKLKAAALLAALDVAADDDA